MSNFEKTPRVTLDIHACPREKIALCYSALVL